MPKLVIDFGYEMVDRGQIEDVQDQITSNIADLLGIESADIIVNVEDAPEEMEEEMPEGETVETEITMEAAPRTKKAEKKLEDELEGLEG